MLNSIERQILNTFINIYEMNILNYIDKNKENLNIIFDQKHISDKLIDKFYIKEKKYINYILYLSILYSIEFSDNEYNKYLDNYKDKVNYVENLDQEFKRYSLYNSIKYLLLKSDNKISLIKEELNFKDNLSYFKYINKLNLIYTIKDLQKIIIFKIIQKYNPLDIEEFLYSIITTDDFDNDLVSLSLGFIKNTNDTKILKNILIRQILLNAFIIEEKLKREALNNVKDFDTEIFDETYISTPTLMFINETIKNNNYYLPKDSKIYRTILNRYLCCLFNEEYESSVLMDIEKEHKNKLNKIYPLYKIR